MRLIQLSGKKLIKNSPTRLDSLFEVKEHLTTVLEELSGKTLRWLNQTNVTSSKSSVYVVPDLVLIPSC